MAAGAPFVAIIDKDKETRKAIGRLLRAQGFRPQGYASAEAFLLRGRIDEPACLLLDIEPDGASERELLDRLKAEGSSIPIVVMTAVDNESGRRSLLAAGRGRGAYLQKPFSAELLLDAIANAIRPTAKQ